MNAYVGPGGLVEEVERAFCPKVSVMVSVVESAVGALVTVISQPHAG